MIDVGFDFTSDSPGYWDKFWENNDGLGGGGSDPDVARLYPLVANLNLPIH